MLVCVSVVPIYFLMCWACLRWFRGALRAFTAGAPQHQQHKKRVFPRSGLAVHIRKKTWAILFFLVSSLPSRQLHTPNTDDNQSFRMRFPRHAKAPHDLNHRPFVVDHTQKKKKKQLEQQASLEMLQSVMRETLESMGSGPGGGGGGGGGQESSPGNGTEEEAKAAAEAALAMGSMCRAKSNDQVNGGHANGNGGRPSSIGSTTSSTGSGRAGGRGGNAYAPGGQYALAGNGGGGGGGGGVGIHHEHQTTF